MMFLLIMFNLIYSLEDKVLIEMLKQRINENLDIMSTNQEIMTNVEDNFKNYNGDKEFCVRRRISSLRTIEKIYSSFSINVSTNLETFNKLEKLENLNKSFLKNITNIEDCLASLDKENIITKNVFRRPKEHIKHNLRMEEFKAAKDPFR